MSRQHAAGLALSVALVALGLWADANYGAFARFMDVAGLRAWLTELRMPVLCGAGFLLLTAASWLWKKLGLGC